MKQIAAEWGVPFYCVRAVSDTASEDMPLDFNLYRDSEGAIQFASYRHGGHPPSVYAHSGAQAPGSQLQRGIRIARSIFCRLSILA